MSSSFAVAPGRSLGFITLGVSLHSILTRLKAQPHVFPNIDLSYSVSDPVRTPVVVDLPRNGLRLRFDGPDQRLRLIEVLDFTKVKLTYKSTDISKAGESAGDGHSDTAPGPPFRHVYQRLLGPTFPGEYVPPSSDDSDKGTYVLSYPGIAFSFPLLSSAWSPSVDFVSLLSSSAASPATSMAIFHGESWPKARDTLYSELPPNPRSLGLSSRAKDGVPDEVELAKIHGEGRLELVRRSSPAFWITLSETTAQDLVSELGPPDAIYRKNDHRLSIHRHGDTASPSFRFPNPEDGVETDHSSGHTETDDSDREDNDDTKSNDRDAASAECFYNYFQHGFDVFLARPTFISPLSPGSPSPDDVSAIARRGPFSGSHLTVSKIIFHGNVPGSFPFNRHRRSRWTLEHTRSEDAPNSEMPFDDVSTRLKQAFPETRGYQQRPMVLNRGWGGSPGSSCELLGGWEESMDPTPATKRRQPDEDVVHGEKSLGNTELFGFPGMVFEVLKNGAISALTVF